MNPFIQIWGGNKQRAVAEIQIGIAEWENEATLWAVAAITI